MKKLPITIQFTLILFLVLVIPTGVISMYSGYALLDYSREEIASTAEHNLDANRRSTEAMMDNMVRNVQQLVSSFEFNSIAGMTSYAEEIPNTVNRSHALSQLQQQVYYMAQLEPSIHSMFFYLDGADYVVSSDRGISQLSDYPSISWLDNLPAVRSSGAWYARSANNASPNELRANPDIYRGVNTVSYVYKLSRLTTSVNGTFVVNVTDGAFTQYLGAQQGADGYIGMLLDADGTIISHPDSNLFLSDGTYFAYVNEILAGGAKSGSGYFTEGGQDKMYIYTSLGDPGWIYVTVQSVQGLNEKAADIQRNAVLLMVLVVFAAAALAAVLITWISKPLRQLVHSMRESVNLEDVKERNEMVLLDNAFRHVQQQERELRELLQQREKDSVSLALRNLLSGDYTAVQSDAAHQIFHHNSFVVVLCAIDNYAEYRRRTNTEARVYNRYRIINEGETLLQETLEAYGVRYEEGEIAFLISFDEQEYGGVMARLDSLLPILQQKATEVCGGFTCTVSVGGVNYGDNAPHDSVAQAREALQNRLLLGRGHIIRHEQVHATPPKYLFLPHSEQRILNYLDTANVDAIKAELWAMQEKMQMTPGVSYDNVMFIYNQLLGSTIQYLAQKGVNTGQLFTGRGNIYAAVTSLDTLQDITEYLVEFYRDILLFVGEEAEKQDSPLERVLQYLQEHYREDVVFEDMAAALEISYSYMRKLVREGTGKSLLDTLNAIRIQEAKRLLLESEFTLNEIAAQVGYHNSQSLSRFFKKFEGVNPGEYKANNGMVG